MQYSAAFIVWRLVSVSCPAQLLTLCIVAAWCAAPRALGERAKRYSRDKLRRVPYGVALAADSGNKSGLAKLANAAMALGGKLDDITVVVAKVTVKDKTNKQAFSMAKMDSEANAAEVKVRAPRLRAPLLP